VDLPVVGVWSPSAEGLNSQDPYLKYMADNYELTVFSVGYRLAPEDPWPAGAHDCYDAAEWLVKNGKEKFGGELMFTGGEVKAAANPLSPFSTS
jgi:acetyl esterase/lipase